MTAPAPTRRRWLNYSLRTLFVLVTVLCVWLGLWANHAERQKRAVAWINENGGHAEYDFEFTYEPSEPNDGLPEVDGAQFIDGYEHEPDENGEWNIPRLPGPRWLHELLGVDYFANVVKAEIAAIKRTSGAAPILDLPRLRYLTLGQTPTGAWADRLGKLQSLRCDCERVTAADLEQVGRLKTLRRLVFFLQKQEPTFGDAQLKSLENLTELTELEIHCFPPASAFVPFASSNMIHKWPGDPMKITDAGLACLRRMKKLESLTLDCQRVTEAGVANLAELPRLRDLNLGGEFDDATIERLQDIPNLETVRLWNVNSTRPGIAKLKAARPTLEISTRDQPGGGFF